MAELSLLMEKLHRAHGLVEQYAASTTDPEPFARSLGRILGQLKFQFMAAGLDAMSQLAGSMEVVSKRSLAASSKSRILREGVGSLRSQMDIAQRAVVSDDKAARAEDAVDDDRAAQA